MSAVEYKLLSKKKTAPTYEATDIGGRADAQLKTYERDIFRRIRTRDVSSVTRQLATLLRAGMAIVPALSALAESASGGGGIRGRDNPLADIIKQVGHDVNSGSTLAEALSKHPDAFSNLFVSMVAAGETSGTLEEVLLRLAEILEKRAHLSAKVKSAIAYPLMMTVVAVGVVIFLMSVVVPSITAIFIEMNRPLPWPTKLLISISSFMETYLVVIIPVFCIFILGIPAACRTKSGPGAPGLADRWKLKLPLFGKLFLKSEIACLTRTLGILLISGIPILQALEIAKQVIQNSVIANAIDSVRDMVGKGEAIAYAIRKTGLFPPIVYHIIATGQISGNVEEGLISIADMYDGEVELTMKTLTSLLEPVILLFMGAVVGFIVLAILLPIFDINQVL